MKSPETGISVKVNVAVGSRMHANPHNKQDADTIQIAAINTIVQNTHIMLKVSRYILIIPIIINMQIHIGIKTIAHRIPIMNAIMHIYIIQKADMHEISIIQNMQMQIHNVLKANIYKIPVAIHIHEQMHTGLKANTHKITIMMYTSMQMHIGQAISVSKIPRIINADTQTHIGLKAIMHKIRTVAIIHMQTFIGPQTNKYKIPATNTSPQIHII